MTQPWATLVACGAKRIETRSWSTPYRGPLAIHAAKGFPLAARALCVEEPFAAALRRTGYGGLALLSPAEVLPRGAVLAVCTLVDVVPTDPSGLFGDEPLEMVHHTPEARERERAFGDYGPNRYAWLLKDVVPLEHPVPAHGALGVWTLDPTVDVRVAHVMADAL